MAPNVLQAAIKRLAFGESLSAQDSADAFGVIMQGEASAAQISALLMGLRVKGETADEVAGAARALRGAMVLLETDRADELVDTCGTGGGAVTTFNISTAAALVAAGTGVRVAKHGNRSFTSQCGSADVLEALGVPLDAAPREMADVLREAGIVFMYAPTMHPAMRHVGPVRREIAVPTVMNIVGPLANPADAGRQVVGVAEPRRLPLLAGALAALGTRHALVVYGEPGMDEISPLGPTSVSEIRDGTVVNWILDPRDYGFTGFKADELGGGNSAENASIIAEVLRGEGNPAGRAAVILNAAAALYVAGKGKRFDECVAIARAALAEGAGLVALNRLRDAYVRARKVSTGE
jgi:anthranilate phosphoribosyltransferase